jgi:hypothetical protein
MQHAIELENDLIDQRNHYLNARADEIYADFLSGQSITVSEDENLNFADLIDRVMIFLNDDRSPREQNKAKRFIKLLELMFRDKIQSSMNIKVSLDDACNCINDLVKEACQEAAEYEFNSLK